mgnify:FL=1
MKQYTKIALMAGVALIGFSEMAVAKDLGDGPWAKERFQVRLRGIGVIPDDGGTTTIGGKPDAQNAVVPEIDVTYFLNQNWALELIAATSPHDLKLKNSALGDVDLGDSWILPPTLTLQYHFTPDNKFSP